jgi:hypothetical protein
MLSKQHVSPKGNAKNGTLVSEGGLILAFYSFSSPRFIISGIFQCILVMPSFITFMSSSLTSTSNVIFKRPFFSSDIESPPKKLESLWQLVSENVVSLFRSDFRFDFYLVVELAEPSGVGSVVADYALLFPDPQVAHQKVRYGGWRKGFKRESYP